MRCPLQLGGVDGIAGRAAGAEVMINNLGRQSEDMLPLVIADQRQLLQDDDDVVCANARRVADFFDGDGCFDALEIRQNDARPVRVVRNTPQVAERALRRAHLPFLFRQLVGKGYEKLAVAFSLVRRYHKNAGEVVSVFALFFFRKVADDVVAVPGPRVTKIQFGNGDCARTYSSYSHMM
jgi:hypothetical protein